MKINAIITGATGMVGEGVLRESLSSSDVERILVIGRRPCRISDPRLTEILLDDFLDISAVMDQLRGYNACFFCLGVSSVGMNKDDYYRVTYTLTMHFAEKLAEVNPEMTFCYISGAGTDSSENGPVRWARVKGKTENDLMKLPFRKVYAFRPGLLKPSKDMRNVHKYYRIFIPLYPFMRAMFPRTVSTLSELGMSMIHSVSEGYGKNVLEVRDIVKLAGKIS
ncbi:MAG: NAD-dependent epimerase/dehydratase family protein [Bacteroidales bacterium]|jgi:uncharacterized protein YbjT (DUF2867 family)